MPGIPRKIKLRRWAQFYFSSPLLRFLGAPAPGDTEQALA
jgi:hypothetical protein